MQKEKPPNSPNPSSLEATADPPKKLWSPAEAQEPAKVFVLGLEPRTVCVLDRRDNQLHHTNISRGNSLSGPVLSL